MVLDTAGGPLEGPPPRVLPPVCLPVMVFLNLEMPPPGPWPVWELFEALDLLLELPIARKLGAMTGAVMNARPPAAGLRAVIVPGGGDAVVSGGGVLKLVDVRR